jgi:hypothetical protein
MIADSSQIFAAFLGRKGNKKVLACVLLLILKILFKKLISKLFAAYRKPPLTLKSVPIAACASENCSESRL